MIRGTTAVKQASRTKRYLPILLEKNLCVVAKKITSTSVSETKAQNFNEDGQWLNSQNQVHFLSDVVVFTTSRYIFF